MIAMLIADAPDEERQAIVREAGWQAAKLTQENWQWTECGSFRELEKAAQGFVRGESHDFLCVDLTMRGTEHILKLLEEIRAQLPETHIILIANTKISPVQYMKPSIRAQSLMLKPLSNEHVSSVMGDAIRSYCRELETADRDRFFILETGGNRRVIAFEKILFFEAREKKVFLNNGQSEYGFYQTLDGLSEQLEDGFLRCHRSFLVNAAKIQNVSLAQNLITMTDGSEIPISRSCKPAVRSYFLQKPNIETKGERNVRHPVLR